MLRWHHQVSPRPNGYDTSNKEPNSRCNADISWQLFRRENFGTQESKKIEVIDKIFSTNDENGHTLRTWTRLDREVLSGRDENVINMQVELKVLHDEPLFCVTRTVETTKTTAVLGLRKCFRQYYPTVSDMFISSNFPH